MYHFKQYTGRRAPLSPAVWAFLDELQSDPAYTVALGRVQLMIAHKSIGRVGGLSTGPVGQYLLLRAATQMPDVKLRRIGFRLMRRSNGSHYWFRNRHNDLAGFLSVLDDVAARAK